VGEGTVRLVSHGHHVQRVAAIDCGTNSIRLLIADIDPHRGRLVDLDRRMTIVRLGEGVDQTGRLSDAALARTFAACEEYAKVIADAGARRVRFVATSASRDASNRDAFVEGVRARIGVAPEVVSGHDEARLSFDGATRDLLESGDADGPYLVVDIGGGSTEFVLGTERPDHAKSVDVGCVRLTERHLRSDPPTPSEIDAAITEIEQRIDEAAAVVPLDRTRTLVGLAGSVTTVAAIALGLDEYDPERIHGASVSVLNVHRIANELLRMTRAERAALGVMHPGRIDVIGGGALVLDRICQRLNIDEVLVSEHDILDGIAWSLV
jgi:exopolyphosphatase/guanosine-5'-triphosphate,3'-diphosphate pyrophosphatase